MCSATRSMRTSRAGDSEIWAIMTASVNARLRDTRSFRTCLHPCDPGCLFQSSGGSAVRIFLASALSSNRAMCLNRERRRTWIVEVRRGWPLQRWKQTGTIWCLMISADTTALRRQVAACWEKKLNVKHGKMTSEILVSVTMWRGGAMVRLALESLSSRGRAVQHLVNYILVA